MSVAVPNQALQRTAATVSDLPGREVGAVAAAAELGGSAGEAGSMMMSRHVSVYARDQDYIIQPSCRTTTGLLVGSEPITLLPSGIADADLGQSVQQALAASREDVAHPTDWKAQLAPLLRCADVRSWNALQKTAKMCEIDAFDHQLIVTPSRNGGISGPSKGYEPITSQAVEVPPDCSADALGKAVLQALRLCS